MSLINEINQVYPTFLELVYAEANSVECSQYVDTANLLQLAVATANDSYTSNAPLLPYLEAIRTSLCSSVEFQASRYRQLLYQNEYYDESIVNKVLTVLQGCQLMHQQTGLRMTINTFEMKNIPGLLVTTLLSDGSTPIVEHEFSVEDEHTVSSVMLLFTSSPVKYNNLTFTQHWVINNSEKGTIDVRVIINGNQATLTIFVGEIEDADTPLTLISHRTLEDYNLTNYAIDWNLV